MKKKDDGENGREKILDHVKVLFKKLEADDPDDNG